jgi:hypothetical protein
MNKQPINQFSLMLLSVVFYAIPVLSTAQQSNDETILRGCATIDDDGLRLSCYDQVLRPVKADEHPVRPGTSDKREQVESAVFTEPQPAPQVQSDQPAVAAEAVTEEKLVAEEKFGLKEKQPREAVSVAVTVKAIKKNLADRFLYTTEDGQVWVQIDTRRVRYDEVPFIAEIRSASLGSFYLRPESGGVSVRVRREK